MELRNLYFVQNKITRIEGLDELVHLRNLELGANRIRVGNSVWWRNVKGRWVNLEIEKANSRRVNAGD